MSARAVSAKAREGKGRTEDGETFELGKVFLEVLELVSTPLWEGQRERRGRQGRAYTATGVVSGVLHRVDDTIRTIRDELRPEDNVIGSMDLAEDDASFRERRAERCQRISHTIMPPSELLRLERQVERVRSLVIVDSEKRLRSSVSAFSTGEQKGSAPGPTCHCVAG